MFSAREEEGVGGGAFEEEENKGLFSSQIKRPAPLCHTFVRLKEALKASERNTSYAVFASSVIDFDVVFWGFFDGDRRGARAEWKFFYTPAPRDSVRD